MCFITWPIEHLWISFTKTSLEECISRITVGGKKISNTRIADDTLITITSASNWAWKQQIQVADSEAKVQRRIGKAKDATICLSKNQIGKYMCTLNISMQTRTPENQCLWHIELEKDVAHTLQYSSGKRFHYKPT